ncbi:non-ribosomal peptide synthetase [Rathayibacter tritici]|uniref:Non-ribosomal peptide synthetase n=1 Tax=Rathayibacter tritici TaxID=33888 RepID=A0A160KRL1_9MICO|nr:non-ribosomal peptide synthetase [Rathayibacter tritici]AND15929.1 non-ribosomal peptide synthetase [Rathayibacter tritici]PPI41070.1 non-ribosomal peptide synthetase [Rathayibacter tritici]
MTGTDTPTGAPLSEKILQEIRRLSPERRRALEALLAQQGAVVPDLGAVVPELGDDETMPDGAVGGIVDAGGDNGPIERRPFDLRDLVPLSAAQQRLWFVAELDGTSAHYNIPLALRISGDLDVGALALALRDVVARHEVLRTSFVVVGGVPRQEIHPAGPSLLGEVESIDPGLLAETCAREALEPFDLANGPLLRVRLLRLGDDDHALLVTIHHSISDGWSMQLLLDELSALYGSHRSGRTSPLAPLPIQYADYAVWQRGWLDGPVGDAQLDHWVTALDGVDPLVTLPIDRPRPAVRSYVGAHERFRWGAMIADGVRALARTTDTTPYMVYLAAHTVLLHRYAATDDVAVGSPVAGRRRLETEDLLGFFANTLVLRTDLSGAPSVRELLTRVRTTVLAALDAQDVPFEAVVEALDLARSRAHAPLFQTMVVLQDGHQDRESLFEDLKTSLVDFAFDVSKFDLTLDLRETGLGVVGAVEYDTALFDATTIRRYVRHLEVMLRAMIATPDGRVSELNGTDDAERLEIARWNSTEHPFSDEDTLHGLVSAAARLHPDAAAVTAAGRSRTYRELDDASDQVAATLRGLDIGPDTPVGLHLDRSWQMVSGLLGILKAGGAYVPLDPEHPEERIRAQLRQAGVATVLTTNEYEAAPALLGASVVVLDDEGRARTDPSVCTSPRPARPAGPTDLAYVIFTSGSTGTPKAVAVEHRAAVNRVEWMQATYGLTSDDAVLQKTPSTFDVSVWEFFWPLTTGARLVVAEPGGHRDPDYVTALIQSEQVTVVHFVPSMLAVVLRQAAWEHCVSLRLVACSGEVLSAALARAHQSRHAAELVNLYGPTEAAVDVTSWSCPATSEFATVPIGRPIQNLRLHVLSPSGTPLGVGQVGELHIAGVGLARGYLNDPERTSAVFRAAPAVGEERVYATGDLARWRADGVLEYISRIDDQVKLRGLRIEPGEIATRLLEQPETAGAAVVVLRDERDADQLVAYLVAEGEPPAPSVVRARLEKVLPQYMVPSAYVWVRELPTTPNGKLDRAALPAVSPDAFARAAPTPVTTATERLLAEIWTDLLGLDGQELSSDDDFFALGGHSLLITVLVARLRDAGRAVDVRSVFDASGLGALASIIDDVAESAASADAAADTGKAPPRSDSTVPWADHADRRAAAALDALPAPDRSVVHAFVERAGGALQDVYPLVPSQEGILFHHLLDPDADPYVIPILLTADDEASAEAFLAALRATVDRHDALRTAVLRDGLQSPLQVVFRSADLRVGRVHIASARAARNHATSLVRAPGPMSLDLAPLMDVTVVTADQAPQCHIVLRAHHLIEDATSIQTLLEELTRRLDGETDLGPAPAYRDFVATTLASSRVPADRYFRERLADVTEPTAPFGLSDIRDTGGGRVDLRRSLPDALSAELRAQARRRRRSSTAVLHAAWALVVAATAARDDVVFGTVLSGRLQDVPGIDRMVGNFINTLPVRVDLRGLSVAGLVEHVDADLRALVVHEQHSLVEAQAASGVAADEALFSSMINVRHVEQEASHGRSLADYGIRWDASSDRTNYPLGLSVDDTGTEFSMNVQVDDRVDGDAVLDYMQSAVQGIVELLASADGGASTAALDVPVLPTGERERLVTVWNDTVDPYPSEASYIDLFDDVVSTHGAATAVEHGARRWTYAELDAAADTVALALERLGTTPGDRVIVRAPRSVEAVASLLGVMRTGAAFVPVDPALPAERLHDILRQSRPRVLVGDPGPSPLPVEVALLPVATSTDGPPEAPTGRRRRVGTTPNDVAYVVFTSGSTGRPKGVEVEHGGLVRLVRNARYFPLTPDDAMLQHSSWSFDVAVQELLGPLAVGARLVLLDGDPRDPSELVSEVDRAGVTSMCLSAAFLPAFVDAARGRASSLRYIGIGGEAFAARQVEVLRDDHPALTVVNAYGPTENSVATTCHVMPPGTAVDSLIPIGRPVSNTTVYVTDVRGRLVPTGVVGELRVGGRGVARGYLGDAERTARSFVPDPFDPRPGARLYRTGDLVRWRRDGLLEFVGRVDDQVKVRGHRIELCEVESVLVSQPDVRDAVVTVTGSGETSRLVAYVQPTDRWFAAATADRERSRLGQWATVFDNEYDADADAGPDLRGWTSSYTGEPIPDDVMEDWAQNIVDRVLDLAPRRVWEVGCGSGVLLERYVSHVDGVVATDVSASAVAVLGATCRRAGWDYVESSVGDARMAPSSGTAPFDLVLVNSVVQYFPGAVYLEEALDVWLGALADDGRILIGDVRDADLHREHLTAVVRSGLTTATAPEVVADLVERRRRSESEFLVGPGWFAALARRHPLIGSVEVLRKPGAHDDELSAYRYDVVITRGSSTARPVNVWMDATGLDDVSAVLADQAVDSVGFSGLPDPRIRADIVVASRLRSGGGDPVEPLSVEPRTSPQDAEDARRLDAVVADALRLGYHVAVTRSGDGRGSVDIVCARDGRPLALPRHAGAWRAVASIPDLAGLGPFAAESFRPRLTERLPEYMVPSLWMVVDEMPITVQGKADRRALPPVDAQERPPASPARTPTEVLLTALVSEVLERSDVDLDDSFFDLGGQSLLAARLSSLVSTRTGASLPLAVVLSGATVREMALLLERSSSVPQTQSAPIPTADDAPDALSAQQSDLWFLADRTGSRNVQMAHRVWGDLDAAAFVTAMADLVARHAALRTSFRTTPAGWEQITNPADGFVTRREAVGGEAALGEWLAAERLRPFRHDGPFLVRSHLLRLGPDEHVAVLTRPWGVFDGWSTGILLADLDELYRDRRLGRTPEPGHDRPTPGQLASRQARSTGPAVRRAQEAHWRDHLAGAPAAPAWRSDYERPAERSESSGMVECTVHETVAQALVRRASDSGVSLATLLLGAFAVTMGDVCDDDEMVISVPVSNRPPEQADDIVGYFVQAAPIRLPIGTGTPFGDVLAVIADRIAEATENDDVPLGRFVPGQAESTVTRHHTVFTVLPSRDTPGERELIGPQAPLFVPVETTRPGLRSDLQVTLLPGPAGLAVTVEYSCDLFARATVQSLVGRYDRMLARVASDHASSGGFPSDQGKRRAPSPRYKERT